jgi:DNA-binding transcriptional LysR family regulator
MLIDADVGRPLSRYLRDAPGGVGDLEFAGLRRMGTIAAIRAMVLAEEGVAVLPEYYVREDLARRRLRRLLPSVPILSDRFRLVFRADDPRSGYFDALAIHMRGCRLS